MRHPRSVYALTIPILAVITGCAAPDRSADSAVLRDSAGIAILELPREPFGAEATWTVSPEPRLTIGAEAGEAWEEFDRIVGARRLADGSIVVADGRSNELRVFDAAGAFIRTIGGEGGGPGEFRGISWLEYIPPDTLVVMDPGLFRASTFTVAGDLVSEVSVPAIGYPWPGGFRMPDGTLVFVWETVHNLRRVAIGESAVGQTSRSTMVLIRHAADGAILDTLGTFAGREEAVFTSNGRLASSYAAWGRMLVFARDGDLMVLGTQDRGEVRAYRPSGELARAIRWPSGDLTLRQTHVDSFLDIALASVEDPEARQRLIAEYRERPVTDSLPAYGKLLVDAEGLLWISERVVPIRTPGAWAVIDPDSGVLGSVRMPDRFELFEVGADYLLGRATDDLGVQRVQLHELRRD